MNELPTDSLFIAWKLYVGKYNWTNGRNALWLYISVMFTKKDINVKLFEV